MKLRFQFKQVGGVAQMVERSLSMREVPGSIPGASNSKLFVLWNLKIIIEAVFAEHHFHCKDNFLSNSICVDEMYIRPFGIFKDATNHWSSGQKHPTDQYPKRI